MEHYTLALTTLAAPHPVGFIPFFAYLGYRVLKFDQFLWYAKKNYVNILYCKRITVFRHVKAGTFDLQIDLVKIIMAGMYNCKKRME